MGQTQNHLVSTFPSAVIKGHEPWCLALVPSGTIFTSSPVHYLNRDAAAAGSGQKKPKFSLLPFSSLASLTHAWTHPLLDQEEPLIGSEWYRSTLNLTVTEPVSKPHAFPLHHLLKRSCWNLLPLSKAVYIFLLLSLGPVLYFTAHWTASLRSACWWQ